MKKILLLAIVSALALVTTNAHAVYGRQGPYVYTFPGDPTGASINSINPPAGSAVIDPATGNRYLKASSMGDNSVYGTFETIFSGPSIDISGTTAVTSAAVVLPANAGKFLLTSANIVVVTSTSTTTAPAVAIYSGTTTALTGTTTLTGTAANTGTVIAGSTTSTVLDTGTTGLTINLKVITTGTSANLTVKPIIRLFRIPNL